MALAAPLPEAQAAPDGCARAAPLPLDFRFRTGARPTSTPAVSADGHAYVGTSEGYVHALGPDGSYLWGYTLRGPVVGELVLSGSGGLLVPTPRRIYALRADGSLAWVFESPIPIHAGLAADGFGRYFFASDDGRLFALSSRGALIAHVAGKALFSSPPVTLGKAVGVARSDGSAVLAWFGKNQRFELGAPARELFACEGAAFCALAGEELLGVDTTGVRFRLSAERASAAGDRIAVITRARRLEVYAKAGSERVFEVPLPAEASAAPLVDPRGRVFVPLENGALFGFSERGAPLGCSQFAESPLGRPIFDPVHNRVWVIAREGLLLAVEAR